MATFQNLIPEEIRFFFMLGGNPGVFSTEFAQILSLRTDQKQSGDDGRI